MQHFVPLPLRRRIPGVEYRYRHETGATVTTLGETSRVVIDFEVSHRDGGMNWFSGSTEARGVELTIATRTVDPSGSTMQSMSVGPEADGRYASMRVLILPLARRNDRETTRAAEWLDGRIMALVSLWVDDQPAALQLLRSLQVPARTPRGGRLVRS